MRWEGVRVTGADEHVRRRAGADRFVTVIADPAPVRERRGPSRTRGIVTGHFKKTLKTWLAGEPDSWKAGIEVVAMDGIGWAPKSAASEELPGSVPVMDPLHAHQRAQALDECRQRARRQIRGRKGPGRGPPVRGAPRPPHWGRPAHTPSGRTVEESVFDHSAHTGVELTRSAYLRMLRADRDTYPSRAAGTLRALIRTLTEAGTPRELVESDRLGRTLKRRRADILTHYPPLPHPSGPTKATGGRLEHLRSTALGFRNQTRYRLRGPLETDCLAYHLHPKIRRTTKRPNHPFAHYPAAH